MELPEIITDEMRDYFIGVYLKNPDSLQDILIELNIRGCSQMQSVVLLMEQLNLSLVEANRIILNSLAWND